jgi:hypothetical protein
MAIHTMMPVVDADELEKAVNTQFSCEINDIRGLLFGNNYTNDSYQSFWYDDLEVYTGGWQVEEDIDARNFIRAYLKNILPNYSYVLIDLSW